MISFRCLWHHDVDRVNRLCRRCRKPLGCTQCGHEPDEKCVCRYCGEQNLHDVDRVNRLCRRCRTTLDCTQCGHEPDEKCVCRYCGEKDLHDFDSEHFEHADTSPAYYNYTQYTCQRCGYSYTEGIQASRGWGR